MRRLASIQKIKEILPIEGADLIVLAKILDWQCVVKKDEFKVNDLCVFCEIDSFIPNKIAPFLTKEGKSPREYNGIKGEKIKSCQIRKQISQGLALPLSCLKSKGDIIYKDNKIFLEITNADIQNNQ